MISAMKPTLKILILDNTREPGSFGSPDLLHWAVRSAPVGSEVMMRRAPDQDLDFSIKPDALILSGSVTSCLPPYESWVSEYDRYVTEQIQKKTPILGICFGHQTLARCLFKREGLTPALAKAKDAEHGWEKVRVVGKSTLFEGLEEGFFTSHSHYEEITEVPPGSRRVGS